MIYHILNGDALAERFDLEGEKIVCRECLVDGDTNAENFADLMNVRAEYIQRTFDDGDYQQSVKSEFEKMRDFKPVDEINLWFGNEVFCQVNLWFCLWLSAETGARFYRVFPDSSEWDCGFQNLSNSYEQRRKLSVNDVNLGKKLWKAFSSRDFESLNKLSETDSENFLRLPEVCQALIEKDSKLQAVLLEITAHGETEFGEIFNKFQVKAAIYGLGDAQVKNILRSEQPT